MQASTVLKFSEPPKAAINFTALSSRDWLLCVGAAAVSALSSRPSVLRLKALIAKRNTK